VMKGSKHEMRELAFRGRGGKMARTHESNKVMQEAPMLFVMVLFLCMSS
jgi:hypothetical protein